MAFESTRANSEHVTTECSDIWSNIQGTAETKEAHYECDLDIETNDSHRLDSVTSYTLLR
jgi:hypothetical protein